MDGSVHQMSCVRVGDWDCKVSCVRIGGRTCQDSFSEVMERLVKLVWKGRCVGLLSVVCKGGWAC